jgi:tRNA A37 methylthiotransferase MiaB
MWVALSKRVSSYPTELESDVIIYNTCAVKGPTENRIIDVIKHGPKDKKS